MRKFTHFLMTLALLMVWTTAVNAERVYRVVYSEYEKYPWYAMGYTPTWVDGIMTDDGKNQTEPVTGWHQYFIADGIPTVEGNDYVVKALVRCNGYFDLTVNMGWGWDPGQSKSGSVHLTPTTDFVWVEWSYKGIGGTSCNLVAQPWSGNTKFEFKELAVYTADPQYNPIFGDLHTVTPHMYAKNGGESYGTLATPDGDGEYTITSVTKSDAADWDTQFWIASPEQGLPAGQKFKVKFEYKAEHAANVQTQTQGQENAGYLTWHCVGVTDNQNIDFTTGWQSLEKEVTIENDMAGWRSIAFNLNRDKTANKYYFRNIALEVPEFISATVDLSVGAAGWATYSINQNVDLGAAKGYKAHYNGSSIELTPVTQVPANEAVLIEGAGKYTFNVIASATALTDNDLKVSNGSVTGDGTIYVLSKKDDVVGFYKLKTGSKVPAGKAYLKIGSASSPDFLGLDGGATSIEAVKKANVEDGVFYNISGQRVANPTKGLYIVNGKKYVIK